MLGKHPEDPFRPTTYKNNNLTWNGKRLTSYGTNTYKYNSEGIRISKTTSEGEYKYLLDGNKIIKEIKPTNKEIYYHYDEKEELVGFNYNTKEYFYIRDITGNITNIIDSIGTIKVSYEYDAWGKVINIDGDEELIEINSYLYKGYYYDKETSLYYCNSRYYDPEIRRWISIDDINYLDSETINGVNLYAYCMNNPVMCSDSSGHMPKWLGNVLTGIGIVVGTALFVAAIVASAGTVGALVGVGAAAIGLSTTAVSTAITVATISTYVVAGGVALFGASDAVEAFSGDINPIRDYVMGGNQTAYNITSGIFNTLGTVAVITGMVGPKILQKIAQRGGVPKISNGKTVGYSMDFFDKKGNWSLRIDATTHGNPKYHYNPHVHYLERDVKQGGRLKNVKYFWEIIKGWF